MFAGARADQSEKLYALTSGTCIVVHFFRGCFASAGGSGGGGGGGGGSGGGKAAVPKILTKLNEHCHVKYDTLDKQHELQVLCRQSCTCMQSG